VELDRHLGLLMLDWCTHKDLSRIACWIEPALLGTFVKAVMRVVSYIEVLKEVVLGLGFYEVCMIAAWNPSSSVAFPLRFASWAATRRLQKPSCEGFHCLAGFRGTLPSRVA